MKSSYLRRSAGLCMGLAALALSVGLLACGDDSGTSPDASSSSAQSSSSAYAPVATDSTAPVAIEDFGYSAGTDVLYLEGRIYVDDLKDSTVTQIDSLVFGSNPAGPLVIMTGTATGKNDVDLALLKAKIVLTSFDSCGEFTLYMTAWAKGKPVTDSLTFTKSGSYCQVASSSSVQQGKAFSSSSFKLAAQKKAGGIHAVDLDAGIFYSDVDSIAAAASTVDIIFGYENDVMMLYTPNDVGAVTDYASIDAAGAYTGSFYDAELPVITTSTTTDQITLRASDKVDLLALTSNASYVVTTDKYNASTGAGLFVLQFPVMVADNALEATVTVWSVVQ